jgi:hypothetical protein
MTRGWPLPSRRTPIVAILLVSVVVLTAGRAEALVYRYRGTITEIVPSQPGLVLPIELGDPFSIEMDLGTPAGQAGFLFTIDIDVFSWSGHGGALVLVPAPQGSSDQLAFSSNETGPQFEDGFYPAGFSLNLADPTQTVLPHPFMFPETAPDPSSFAFIEFNFLLHHDTLGQSVLRSTSFAIPEPPIPALVVLFLASLVARRRRSRQLAALLLSSCLATATGASEAVADAGHCVAGQTPPLKSCGTGANGLTNASTTCKTVVVMNDTQHHVNLNPVISTPLNPNGDAAILHDLVDWILQEAPASKENVAFALHTGDIVEAAARVGVHNSMPLHVNCLNAPVNGCAGYEGLTSSAGNPGIPGVPGSSCSCWAFHNITREWDLFWGAWSRLNGVVPYAIVAGNHDNAGFLQGGGGGDPFSSRERNGYFQYFSPLTLDQANAGFQGFRRVDTFVVTDLAGPEPLLRRRGASHAWRFTLGPHQVGVLGLDYLFATIAEPGDSGAGVTASINWGTTKKTVDFADVPVIGVSHQWFNNGSLSAANLNWVNFVAPPSPQLEKQLFWAAEGHHTPLSVSLKDRDSGRSDDNDFPVLHTRSYGQGDSQIYLVRFLFRSLADNIAALNGNPAGTRDELEVFALKNFPQMPTTGVSLSEWTRVLCEDFSIFYNDRDLDGILDHLDNCPAVGNPDQGDVIVGLPGDEWADLNLDLKIDAGDLLVAMRAAAGDITDPTVLARADVAPARDDKRVDAADVQLMMRAVARELQAACLGQ